VNRGALLGVVAVAVAICAIPSASASADSIESVSRRSIPSRRTRRSTTTSIVCCS